MGAGQRNLCQHFGLVTQPACLAPLIVNQTNIIKSVKVVVDKSTQNTFTEKL